MVQGTAPMFIKQVVETDTYYAKLQNDGIDLFDDYDFATGKPTGGQVEKYWADVEFDGVEDENKPGQCYTKRLFFKLATGERANLPKFLRAIAVPLDERTGDFDTSPAVGKAWVTLSVVKKMGKTAMTNTIESYTKDRSHKATDHPALSVAGVDAEGWPEESPAEPPF